MGHKANEKLGSSYCHGLGGNQVFAYTKRQQIMSDDNCLDSASARGPVNLVRCHGMRGNQEWKYNSDVKHCSLIQTKPVFLIIFLFPIRTKPYNTSTLVIV